MRPTVEISASGWRSRDKRCDVFASLSSATLATLPLDVVKGKIGMPSPSEDGDDKPIGVWFFTHSSGLATLVTTFDALQSRLNKATSNEQGRGFPASSCFEQKPSTTLDPSVPIINGCSSGACIPRTSWPLTETRRSPTLIRPHFAAGLPVAMAATTNPLLGARPFSPASRTRPTPTFLLMVCCTQSRRGTVKKRHADAEQKVKGTGRSWQDRGTSNRVQAALKCQVHLSTLLCRRVHLESVMANALPPRCCSLLQSVLSRAANAPTSGR